MNILELCDEVPAAVTLNASAGDAIQSMLDNRVGAVAVVDENHCVAGIFTERDVLKKLALSGQDPAQTPVRSLMTTPVQMATVETSAGEALEVMVDRHIRHLPITDPNGKLLGILSIRHLLQSKVDDLTHQLDALETSLTNDAQGG
ncbi:MAG: CBS domain-containing protein [Acidobacteria bacterium]|nr:CBS domain-containing protein [Acidobacteriota bacterium]